MTIGDDLEKKISELSEVEQKVLLKQLSSPDIRINTYDHNFSSKHVKIGVIADTHIGHIMFDEELFLKSMAYFKKEKVEAIYHVGDIVDGVSHRDGTIFELSHVGFNSQVEYAAMLFSQSPVMIYGITGNHDDYLFKRGNIGADVGKYLHTLQPNKFTFLGHNEANINLSPNIKMKLIHPNDGSSYAYSYKIQKMVESFGGGEKPNILFEGNYHKSMYMFLRNIHCYESGTFENQTEFMRLKKLAAHKGFWVADIYMNKKSGIERIKNTFIPKYD